MVRDPDLESLLTGLNAPEVMEAVTADLAAGLINWTPGIRHTYSRLVPMPLAVLDDITIGNTELVALAMEKTCFV